MPSARDDLVRLTRQGVEAVDTVFRALATRLSAYTRAFGPLTRATLPAFRAGVQRILAPIFGLTQAAAQTATLFTTISGALAPVFDAPFQWALTRLRTIVQGRDPGLSDILDRKLLAASDSDRLSLAYRLLYGPQVEKARLRRALGFDPNRVWVRGDGTPYRLSQRIWKAGTEVQRGIDERIKLGISRGDDALKIADDLNVFLNPEYAPVRYRQDGRIIRRNLTLAPGRGGWGGTHARLLARTEVSRVHAEATRQMALTTPGVTGLRWALSGRHLRSDRCDDLSRADNYDLGAGVYPAEHFPRMPQHPACLCVSVPTVMSRDETIDLIIKRYGGRP